jgi:hypothetical protein
METNDYIVSDMNIEGVKLFILGHHFYDRFFSEDRMNHVN